MPTSSLRILIVEDEPLIAMMIEDFLDVLGHRLAGSAETVAAALDRIAAGEIDAAIVDVNLRGGEQSWPVAAVLKALGIPFVLATGSGGEDIDAAYAACPVLAKPFSIEGVEAALTRLG